MCVNNFVYDYQAAYTTTTSARYHHDLINNYFVTGPYTSQPADNFFQLNTNAAGGLLSGAMMLSKDGSGTLTIANSNNFTGSVNLFGGGLVLNNASAAGLARLF